MNSHQQSTSKWGTSRERKLNVDAAKFEIAVERWMGADFVVRNMSGEVELAGTRRMLTSQTVEAAELSALVWSLRCRQRENTVIKEIELDCKAVVDWIKGRHLSGVLGHVVEDCLNLTVSIYCDTVLHCPRKCNEVMHLLAKRAKDISEEAVAWLDISHMPNDIQLVIMREFRSSFEGFEVGSGFCIPEGC
ncbi:Uncharacterized protein TCM_017129 [Theobroma cacao]|uniref:RNase H type-1 domain-containing protein n=1 Tax=Theobroma cacao TaxID=3641 RepID=A0A061EKE3_THECC|nr:Uncharacterized protein TCM_017129 [Theobroma cacao]